MASFKLTSQTKNNDKLRTSNGFTDARVYVDTITQYLSPGQEEYLSVVVNPGANSPTVSFTLNEADAKLFQERIFNGRKAMKEAREKRLNKLVNPSLEDAW